MAFEAPDSNEKKEKAGEVAMKLDEICLEENIDTIRDAIKMMGLNTRVTLLKAIKATGLTLEDEEKIS